jgi:hypothetical protein
MDRLALSNVRKVYYHRGSPILVFIDAIIYFITGMYTPFVEFTEFYAPAVMRKYNELNPHESLSLVLLSATGHSTMPWDIIRPSGKIPIHDAIGEVYTLYLIKRNLGKI